MKKISSVLIASALVLGVTACSSNSEEVSKEESGSNKSAEEKNENSSAVKTKENNELPSEKAIRDMQDFFAYIDEENVSKVAELLRHTEGSNEVPNKNDVKDFIKEWKSYNFKENGDLQIINTNDLVKEEREEVKNFDHQIFWMVCSYKGDINNEFSKMLVVAEYNGKFYMVDDVPVNSGMDAIQKRYWEKYEIVNSDQVKLEELPDTSTKGVEPKEIPDASKAAIKPKQLDPDTQEETKKKSGSSEKSDTAPDVGTPPVEQVAPQKEYDYDNSGGYIIGDALLADVLNTSFSAYHDLIGSNMVEFQRDGDYGFSVTTDTKTLYVLFKSKDGKNWAITDLKTGEKLIENGVKVGEQKARLFDTTQFDYSNSKGYIIGDKEFADVLNNAFSQHSDVVGTKMISFHRKDDYQMVVQTDKRNLRIEIIEGGVWMIMDHNTALPLLENE
ncbi:hypothetical protein P4679_23030 [Priestia megaterium]|uniref:hypothetical protein n=1 Tax=Priestia megaterium TaxID=1404 RepID=UPI002E22330D|nr:hypothetical protein [Priestia megaterium]